MCWNLFEISSRFRTYGYIVVYSIVTKPHLPVGEQIHRGFFAEYLDIVARSPFPRRYSLRTNDNIWPLLSLLSLSSSGFLTRHKGIIDTAKTSSLKGGGRGGVDNISQASPESPAYDGSPVFIPFKGDPASKSRFLKDSSIIPAFAKLPLFEPRSPSSS